VKADKKQVQLHFARAAATYDEQAVIQLRVAEQLLSLVETYSSRPPDSALEIGCCTGLLTRQIVSRFPGLELLHVNDLVENFRRHIGQIDIPGRIEFLAGDIETLPLPRQYRLIISSSTFHWFHDLAGFFEKLHLHLHADGVLAFSMYGPGNLQEIRALTGGGLEYPSLNQLAEMLEPHFAVLTATEVQEVLFFQDPSAVLQHLRETGVNALTGTGWSKHRLQEFNRQYQKQFSGKNGIRLTYHPMYILARRH